MKHAFGGVIFAALTAVIACGSDRRSPTPDRPPCPAVQHRKAPPVHALILGDRTGHPDDDTFVSILRKTKRLGPDLIIGVGDFIQGYQPDDHLAEAEAEWRHVMGLVRRVFGPDIPLFSTAGNHDVWSEKSEALFEQQLGHPTNFSFELGTARVILFDTSRAENETRISDDDLNWLVKELWYAHDASSRLVITHRPLWALNPGGEYGSPLHDVLIAGSADWVIAGHWHHAMSDERDGIRYRMLGPSGAMPNRGDHPESGNFQQFGWLVVDGDAVDFSILNADGVHRSDAFPYAFNQLEYKIEKSAVVARGFEMDPLHPRNSGPLHLTVTNVSKQPLRAPLTFLETAWRVTPSEIALDLAPGASREVTVSYARQKEAPLFPGPEATLPFDWPGGGAYVLNKAVTPTLSRPLIVCDEPPTLDGVIDDACWRRTVPLGGFNDVRGVAAPVTETRVARFDDRLYVAASIAAPTDGTPRAGDFRDAYLESDSHFLVLVDDDLDTPAYLRVVVNADGALYDRQNGTGRPEPEELAWDGAQTAVSRGPDRWGVELAVPLRGDRGEGDVTPIGFNFSVKRVEGVQYALGWWQPLLEHNRDAFGQLIER